MINIDTRFLDDLDENEVFLAIHLTKRLGKNHTCWPSNETLKKDCSWHIEKIQRVKKSLEDKGVISVKRNVGRSNIYEITSKYIGVYVNGKSDMVGNADNGISENPLMTTTENPIYSHVGKSDNKVLANGSINHEAVKRESIDTRNFVWFQNQLDELFMSGLAFTHRGKDIPQAVRESFAHLAADSHRLKIIDAQGCKRLVNTWLSNQKATNMPKQKIRHDL